MPPPRRSTFLVVANVIAIGTIVVAWLLIASAGHSSGLQFDTGGILALCVLGGGIPLTLLLLIVAAFRGERPGWAYASPIAVLALPFLLLLLSVNHRAGKMDVHGANGEAASFGGSAQLPGWVPGYPGAALEGVYAAEDATQRGGTFGLETGDGVSKVFAFYKVQLEGAGFKVTESKYSGPAGDGGMVMGESGDGKRTVTFTIGTDSGKTRVAGVYSEKKG